MRRWIEFERVESIAWIKAISEDFNSKLLTPLFFLMIYLISSSYLIVPIF